jgi:hypothetical protein
LEQIKKKGYLERGNIEGRTIKRVEKENSRALIKAGIDRQSGHDEEAF